MDTQLWHTICLERFSKQLKKKTKQKFRNILVGGDSLHVETEKRFRSI